MKKVLSIVLAGAIASSLFAYDIAAGASLKTKARTVTRTDFTIVSKFGEYFRTPSSKIIYKFDDQGKITESSELTPRDALVNKIVNTYDNMGNLTAQVCYDADNVQIWNTTITYKDNMKSDCSEFTKGGYLKGKTIYSYSGKNLTDESYYNADGLLVWKIIYKYDDSNRIEHEYEYFGDGTLDEERSYTYNAANQKESISYYDANGIIKSKDVFRYAADNSLSEVTAYDSDGKITKRSLVKTDSFGNTSKVTGYAVLRKFGTTVNEMSDMTEFIYDYNTVDQK